jgi:hypothetical protein
MSRRLPLALLASLAACGEPSPADPPLDPPPAAACTGAAPQRASACPGSSAPAVNTARYVTPACAGQPCSYACISGYAFSAGACVDTPPPPPPRAVLVDPGDGTLRDVNTGARWLKHPGCTEPLGGVGRTGAALAFDATRAWIDALSSGACGLSDGSAAGDWALPTFDELLGLVGATGGFASPPGGPAWTSLEPCSTTAITLDPTTGEVGERPKGDALLAWPVRRP